MAASKRILSIDVMRGITLFLMLFVNDLYVDGVPEWLTHRPADFDGMGLADWVFPGFLFMVGMAVPFAVQNRLKKGDSIGRILVHVFTRTFSLLLIGVLMLNSGRLNPDLTGMHKYLWAILMYVCVFIIWNRYPEGNSSKALALKIPAALCLMVLLVLFRSGTEEEPGWLVTGWWGILGLIGWGYLVTSLTYLFARDNLFVTTMTWFLFLVLNIFSQLGYLEFMDPVKTLFGIVLDGNVPLIVISGLIISLLLRKLKESPSRFILISTILGLFSILLGFVLRNWFIISKIKGTPSWGILCIGISILVFVLLYVIIDKYHKSKWTFLFQQAGTNSLTTYLVPSVIYYIIWYANIPLFVYKQSFSPLLAITGSIVWSLLMLVLTMKLAGIKVQLKL
ncbi:DUF5009 domain-containing protein [Maribellus sp. CM-23]|uniref:DUF5009 domain-containing protein n=1 Tax=Maribellus sp. CM-23 TaxID=2781026 RepID=UPI001F17A4EC|nr:DUF5009 domain-containing protein [Maribellus sp. CM-23]MCE4566869.1 DUF5009 domain-containing protein [Maribellus sp. CM-23]